MLISKARCLLGGILWRSLKPLVERMIQERIHEVWKWVSIGRLKGSKTRFSDVIGRVGREAVPRVWRNQRKVALWGERRQGKRSLGPGGGRTLATRPEEVVPRRGRGWRLSKNELAGGSPSSGRPTREEAATVFSFCLSAAQRLVFQWWLERFIWKQVVENIQTKR